MTVNNSGSTAFIDDCEPLGTLFRSFELWYSVWAAEYLQSSDAKKLLSGHEQRIEHTVKNTKSNSTMELNNGTHQMELNNGTQKVI